MKVRVIGRLVVSVLCLGLVAWGVSLGAWFATVCVSLMLAVLWTPRRRWSVPVGVLLLGLISVVGPIETLWRVHQVGERSRAGNLGLRDQLAVHGFNTAFGVSALVMGFPQFGVETISLALPVSLDGACPADRLRSYGSHLPRAWDGHEPALRVWESDFAMRSPKIRNKVRLWAQQLPARADDGVRRSLGPWGPVTWPAGAYFDADEANGVPVALNALTTMEGEAVRVGDRWRLELVVHLPIAYPKRATMKMGPFWLEEGMWHDARAVLPPYCGEYRWTVWSDDPDLQAAGADRTVLEQLMTAILRAAGARY